MIPNYYSAGRVKALNSLGITKYAQLPETTYFEQGIGKVKKLIPKTPLGRATALGGLIGLGMGIRSLKKPRSQEEMERPNFYEGSALLYPQEY